jgi:hypothetical protein
MGGQVEEELMMNKCGIMNRREKLFVFNSILIIPH